MVCLDLIFPGQKQCIGQQVLVQTGSVYCCVVYIHAVLAGVVVSDCWPVKTVFTDSDHYVWQEIDQQTRECGGRGSGRPDHDSSRIEAA